MRLLCALCFFLLSLSAASQKILKGVVLDSEKNSPIPGASVFLNTTSVGTMTNIQGNFTLSIPNGRYDLIVSSVGYETFSQTITSNEASDFITVRLKIKSEVMQTVVVEPYDKDGWQKWGTFFIENFIGTSAEAKNCTIKNTKVIHFRNSKKTNELLAFADEPLIIENKALGYTIRYQLETFGYNFKTHYLIYTGYPFFQPMKGGAGKQKKWKNRRSEAYFGSMMHFMRSLYRNDIMQQGFDVRRLKKIPNLEKQRVKQAYSRSMQSVKSADGTVVVTHINKDTADYYDRILRQEDYTDVIGKTLLSGDSIAYAVSSTTAGLDFSDYLLVIYKNRPAPAEYRQQFPKSNAMMMSQILLVNGTPVEIEANGSYFDPADLLSMGYWSWSEKIALMLPFDYVPTKL
jgi:hypothetical protein